MFIDIRNKEFNWFDNPYISPNVYELDNNYQTKLSKNIQLELCSRNKIIKFANDLAHHPNALCFADKS